MRNILKDGKLREVLRLENKSFILKKYEQKYFIKLIF